MGTNLQDYVELLNAEQRVQVDKLRDQARHGVSSRVRGEVWLYLLGVLSADKTAEITTIISLNTTYQALPTKLPSSLTSDIIKVALKHHTKRFFNPTYAGLISSITAEPASGSIAVHARESSNRSVSSQLAPGTNTSSRASPTFGPDSFTVPPPLRLPDKSVEEAGLTLRAQYSRFLPPPPTSPPSRHGYLNVVEEVFGRYYNSEKARGYDEETRRLKAHGLAGAEQDWVYLLTPFVCCLSRPVAIFLGFQKLLERLDSFPPLPSRLASILTLFRLALPELFSYFEDEQVPYIEVAISWATTLLAKEMWLGDVLRLWDAYLASDDMFSLHCYVCVAILSTCKDTLEELDGSEAKLMLLDLPPIDVDKLLQDAANLRVAFPLARPAGGEP